MKRNNYGCLKLNAVYGIDNDAPYCPFYYRNNAKYFITVMLNEMIFIRIFKFIWTSTIKQKIIGNKL